MEEETENENENPNHRSPSAILHAFHQNLPPHCHHIHPQTKQSVTYASEYGEGKAKEFKQLIREVDLTKVDWAALDRFHGGDKLIHHDHDQDEEEEDEDGDEEDKEEDAMEEDKLNTDKKDGKMSMTTIVQKCNRMNLVLSSIVSIKHYTLHQRDLAEMLLKLITLLCASLQKVKTEQGTKTVLHMEPVGFLLERQQNGTYTKYDNGHERRSISTPTTTTTTTANQEMTMEEEDYHTSFALPSTARDALLSVTLTLLSKFKKIVLCTASHVALPRMEASMDDASTKEPSSSQQVPEEHAVAYPLQIVLHWKSLFKFLLRTAPNLQERGWGSKLQTTCGSRGRSIVKKTVSLLLACNGFYDQQGIASLYDKGAFHDNKDQKGGVDVLELPLQDTAAREIWTMVRSSIMYQTHTHGCFRGLVVLYLFLPERCSGEFYQEILPQWLLSWSSVDRCNDLDYLYLRLFCRARKYTTTTNTTPPTPTPTPTPNPTTPKNQQTPTPPPFSWHKLRQLLLSQCGYWLQIPVTGASNDRTFPRPAPMRSRGVPGLLKAFVGSTSSYQEGLDFLEKLSCLLVFCLGTNDDDDDDDNNDDDDDDDDTRKEDESKEKEQGTSASSNISGPKVSQGTADLLRFLRFVSPYFNPSNTGSWTFPLGAFLHCLCYEFSQRVGNALGHQTLEEHFPTLAEKLVHQQPYVTEWSRLDAGEVVAVLDALVPLCQLAMYSKNSYVGRAGESSLLLLTQIMPRVLCPPLLQFCTQALDVSSIHMSHQAPSALSLLHHLVQPALRTDVGILLGGRRLTELLHLSLMGIDGNDEKKTMTTLALYHSIAAWLPIGGVVVDKEKENGKSESEKKKEGTGGVDVNMNGTLHLGQDLIRYSTAFESSPACLSALAQLPESSILYQPSYDHLRRNNDANDLEEQRLYEKELYEETALALSAWSLSFLDRVYNLLRAATKREKASKSRAGVASLHSSADAQQTRIYSRYLRSCLRQVFAAMEDSTFQKALDSVCEFVSRETLPYAAKDASALCEAASCGGRGLHRLIPIVTKDLDHVSDKTAVYRLRCLAGAVRSGGTAVLEHRDSIQFALKFALASQDKHIYKTGCKVLRHVLSSQVEAYPFPWDGMKHLREGPLGKSSSLREDPILWHVPNKGQLEFVVGLVKTFALDGILELVNGGSCGGAEGMDYVEVKEEGSSNGSCTAQFSIQKWRRAFKALNYTLRGVIGILLDQADPTATERNENGASSAEAKRLHPHELAVSALLEHLSTESKSVLCGLRARLCAVLASLMSVIVNGNGNVTSTNTDATTTTTTTTNTTDPTVAISTMSSDTKLCMDILECSLLLTTRRGVFSHVDQDKAAVRSLKDLTRNQVLSRQASYLSLALRRAGYTCTSVEGMDSVNKVSSNKGLVLDGLYKDGEDGGKCIPRRLVSSRVWLFYREMQQKASHDIPQRLKKDRRCMRKTENERIFSEVMDFEHMQCHVRAYLQEGNEEGEKPFHQTKLNPLRCYEGLVDGLYAFSCHTHVEVRGSALDVLNSVLSRFGWMAKDRVTRLLHAIELKDKAERDLFGVPSCEALSTLSLSSTAQTSSKEAPSSSSLSVSSQSGSSDTADRSRKRLAEVIKGVCSIVGSQRTMKHILKSEATRFHLLQTLCSAQQLLSVLPTEEHLKVLYYLQVMFSRFRSRWYALQRFTGRDARFHKESMMFCLQKLEQSDRLSTDETSSSGSGELESLEKSNDNGSQAATINNGNSSNSDASMMHWRNKLLVCWFLMYQIDIADLKETATAERIWMTCFQLIQNEMGQPLQRVALGVLGRAISMVELYNAVGSTSTDKRFVATASGVEVDLKMITEKFQNRDFCRTLAEALSFNHKANTEVGGGHKAQWSAGVEDILRDASSNCARQNLFPFQLGGLNCSVFKVQHAKLVKSILSLLVEEDVAIEVAKYFLDVAKGFVNAPPSEDQRNLNCTAWELFAGVGRALLVRELPKKEKEGVTRVWKMLLAFMEEVLPSTQMDASKAAYDALRFIIQFLTPDEVYPLTDWIICGIENNLWQHSSASGEVLEPNHDYSVSGGSDDVKDLQQDHQGSDQADEKRQNGTNQPSVDGFSSQSKWLYLMTAVTAEMDFTVEEDALSPWYACCDSRETTGDVSRFVVEGIIRTFGEGICERLLPRLLEAIGHPYEKCRDRIAAALFQISHCHRKLLNFSNRYPSTILPDAKLTDGPQEAIVSMFSTRGLKEYSFKQKQHALMTARKFIAYCMHMGDCIFECSNYVIPLLPLVFNALKVVEVCGGETEISASDRALEAEVSKGFRYSLSEISSSCLIKYDGTDDITRVMSSLDDLSKNETWQIRQAAAHFLRCFHGCHKFIFSATEMKQTTNIVSLLLADDRREVSSAAMAALTGILAVTDVDSVSGLVSLQVKVAKVSIMKKKKKTTKVKADAEMIQTNGTTSSKELARARKQQSSVFFLCAAVLARPYDTPPFVPEALEALSKHSFEQRAPLAVRETVKKCFSEFKRTHMTDNWELHRKQFNREQLEALEDVVSTPHYYA